jgi:hypothetical protein
MAIVKISIGDVTALVDTLIACRFLQQDIAQNIHKDLVAEVDAIRKHNAAIIKPSKDSKGKKPKDAKKKAIKHECFDDQRFYDLYCVEHKKITGQDFYTTLQINKVV